MTILPINTPIGSGRLSDLFDLNNTRETFRDMGLYQENETGPMLDKALDTAIRTFQSLNDDLKVDGVMKPGGETENRLFEIVTGQPYPSFRTPGFNPAADRQNTVHVIPDKKPEPKRDLFAIEPVRKPIQSRRQNQTHIPQYKSDPVFDRFRENLKPREGGFVDDPRDRGGATQKGVSQKFLNQLHLKNPELELPQRSKYLNDQQIDIIFREQFFEEPKIDKLDIVAGFHKTNSRLVEHVFDAGVMSGPNRAGEWLQESIDELNGSDLRIKTMNGEKKYDGNIGPKTREALQQIIEQGKIEELSDRFADKRIQFLRKLSNYPIYKNGWEERVQELRDYKALESEGDG